MKCVILLALFLTACVPPYVSPYEAHFFAKQHPKGEVCYKLLEPKELQGKYCVQYKGEL